MQVDDARPRLLAGVGLACVFALALPKPDPLSTAGLLGGAVAGLALPAAGSHRLGVLGRVLAGFVPLAVVFVAVRGVDPGGAPVALGMYGVVHAALGFWLTAGAPRLFRVLRPA